MTTVTLQSIELRNFKGIRELKLEPNNNHCVISGDNGTGKTSVYDAYLWCLFGITSSPNTKVQMLNSNNEIIHHIETSVKVILRIDNEYSISLESRLTEKWDAVGTPNEKFKGTTIQRYYNGTPLSLKEYNTKLEAICDLKDWQMLSNIHSFFAMKMEDRRKLLMSTAEDVNEEELAKLYPAVNQAMNDRKTIEELTKQTKSTKKRAEEDLSKIPAAINAQDRLMINENWEALENEITNINKEIADIDTALEASSEELEAVRLYKEDILRIEEKLSVKRKEKIENNKKAIHETEITLKGATKVKAQLCQDYDTAHRAADEQIKQLTSLTEEKELLKQQWRNVNKEEFSYNDTDVCPVCGNPFTEEQKEHHRTTALNEFLQYKKETLSSIEAKGKLLNDQIALLKGEISIYSEVKEPSYSTQIDEAILRVKDITNKLDELYAYNVDNDIEVLAIEIELKKASANKPDAGNTDKEEKKKQKAQLQLAKEILMRKLGGKETNNRIEAEKQRLASEAANLSQVIADCDNILYQVRQFKKAKIDAVESAVNRYFKIVSWKFFEKNVTNDEEKEICTCILNGVEYESQNTASKVNMSVDILSGISNAKQIRVPMFIDNTESVTTLIASDSQQIALEVVKNKSISLFNK